MRRTVAMADFPMTVKLLVRTILFWSVLPLRTTSVGTFMRAEANCMDFAHSGSLLEAS